MVRVFAVSLVAAAAVSVAACPGRPAALGCANDDDCPAGFCVDGLCSDLAAGGEGEGESNGGEGEANEGEGDVVAEGEGDVAVGEGEGEGEGSVTIDVAPAPTQNSSSTLSWSSSASSCTVTVDGVSVEEAGSGSTSVAFLAGDVEVAVVCGDAHAERTLTPGLPSAIDDAWPLAQRAGLTRRGFRIDVDVTASSSAFAQPKSVSFPILTLFEAAGLNEVPARASIIVKDGANDVASYLSDVDGGERLFIAVPALGAATTRSFAVYLDAGTFDAPPEWIEDANRNSVDFAADVDGVGASIDLGDDLSLTGWVPDALEISDWGWSVDGEASDIDDFQRTPVFGAPVLRLLHRDDVLTVAEMRLQLVSGARVTQFVSAHRDSRLMRALLLVRGATTSRVAYYVDPDLGTAAGNDSVIGRVDGADFFNDNARITVVSGVRATPTPDLVFVDTFDRATAAWDANDLDHGLLDGSAGSEINDDVGACLVWTASNGALDVEVDWSDASIASSDLDGAGAAADEQMDAVGGLAISVGRVWRLVP